MNVLILSAKKKSTIAIIRNGVEIAHSFFYIYTEIKIIGYYPIREPLNGILI